MNKKLVAQTPSRVAIVAKKHWFRYHDHPLAIPVVTFLVLFFASIVGFILLNSHQALSSDSRLVILSHDKIKETIPTHSNTVGEFLEKAGITVSQGDVVEPSQDTPIDDDNFHINVYRGRPVMIQDGDNRVFSFSAATTPRSVAAQSGVQVYPEDGIKSQPQTDFLSDGAIGEKVIIDRATPANLNLYGTPLAVRTHAKTVADLLKEKNVKLAKDDTVQPALTTVLTPDTSVFVSRNGTQVVNTEEDIAMPIQYVDDASLTFGTQAVRQQGSVGKQTVTYELTLVNGKETGRKVIQTVKTKDPITQIVARGKAVYVPQDSASVMAAVGISPSDYAYVNYIIGHEGGWGGVTKSNRTGSGAYGICQALPGSKMASAGADWATNPVTQLRWCNGYAVGKYGSWQGAYNYWLAHHYW